MMSRDDALYAEHMAARYFGDTYSDGLKDIDTQMLHWLNMNCRECQWQDVKAEIQKMRESMA